MSLPAQELFSIDDVAARWKKPVSYVADLIRRGLLPMERGFLDKLRTTQGLRLKLRAFITRLDLETFERKHLDAPAVKPGLSIKEYAAAHNISTKSVYRYIRAKKVDARQSPGGRWLIFEK